MSIELLDTEEPVEDNSCHEMKVRSAYSRNKSYCLLEMCCILEVCILKSVVF